MISEVECVDNMVYMARFPDKFFDLAIVDPPYGIGVTGMNMGSRKTVKPDSTKNWDANVPDKAYFLELFRCSKRQIIWGGNYFELPVSQYFAIWDKGDTMYGRDFAECEFAWVSKGGTRIYKKNPVQLTRVHPTQKPVDLYRWLLQNYAKDGDKILDTHMGSQSSRIASHIEGYDYYGCELDKQYFEQGCKRFELSIQQATLF